MLKASEELLNLLRRGARGEAQRHEPRVRELILEIERTTPADLAAPGALELLGGVWELRWSSSSQPYLQAVAWLENLQILAPSRGRALNLLRPPGLLTALGGIAVEASISIVSSVNSTPAGSGALPTGWLAGAPDRYHTLAAATFVAAKHASLA